MKQNQSFQRKIETIETKFCMIRFMSMKCLSYEIQNEPSSSSQVCHKSNIHSIYSEYIFHIYDERFLESSIRIHDTLFLLCMFSPCPITTLKLK